jgi:hypothetical protein
VSNPIWGSWPDIYYCLTVTVLICGAPSLTRGRVCLLYMLLALASAVFLGSESLGTRDHILLSQIWDFFSVASYDSQGHDGIIQPRLHTGNYQTILLYDTDCTENEASNNYSIVACVFVVAVMFLSSCCLATYTQRLTESWEAFMKNTPIRWAQVP